MGVQTPLATLFCTLSQNVRAARDCDGLLSTLSSNYCRPPEKLAPPHNRRSRLRVWFGLSVAPNCEGSSHVLLSSASTFVLRFID